MNTFGNIEDLVSLANEVLTNLKAFTSQIVDFLFNHYFTIGDVRYNAFSVIFGASVGVFLTFIIIKFIVGVLT